jgi:PLD-like domain
MPDNSAILQSIDKVIQRNLPKFRKTGVLTVRPGYEIAGEQLTGRPAIVATVHTKKAKSILTRREQLPDRIGTFPVDVREATAHQRLRANDPAAAALTQTYGRPEEREPTWPYEREIPSGNYLTNEDSETQTTLALQSLQQAGTAFALATHSHKPQEKYDPQGLPELKPVTLTCKITVMASPDAGFKTLTGFLSGTTQSLVIGMYDFTSGPLLKAFENDLGSPKTLQMVLDNPAPNKTRDQTDTETVQQLNQKLGTRSKIVRALVRSDAFASAWMFPYAYHIKVIVRDGTAMWLSSGNLNNSNEPDPARPPNTKDRDWHVIVEDRGLAQTFAAYLNYDFQSAAKFQEPHPTATEQAIQDANAKLAAEANPPPPAPLAAAAAAVAPPVPAKTFNVTNVTVIPLLTPDKLPGTDQGQYLSNIMKLIQGAQASIFIQLQYIESSSGQGDVYDKLLQALADKVAANIDVRLIESADFAQKWLEKMKVQGVDLTKNIRLQPHVHNKGFVIDGKKVVVSSQNFSPAGITDNRDAGLIIESADIAGYFGPIFKADWDNAKPAVAGGGGGGKKKPAKKKPAKKPTKSAKKKKAAKKKKVAKKKKAAKKRGG